MKKYLFISVSIIILLFSCKKDDIDLHKYAGLPDATQSGQNTMGCLINGKPWVAKVFFPLHNSAVYCTYGELRPNLSSFDSLLFSGEFIQQINLLTDSARFEIQDFFNFQLKPIRKIGTYQLKDLYKNQFEYWYDRIGEPLKLYKIDTAKIQYFEITKLDTIKNIISGIFDLRLVEIDDKNDSLQITNGRFDCLYKQR